jgi:hypothetical protein
MAVAKQTVNHDELHSLRLQARRHVGKDIGLEQLPGLIQIRIHVGAGHDAKVRHKLAELAIVGHVQDGPSALDHFVDLLLRAELITREDGQPQLATGSFLHPVSEAVHDLDDGLFRVHLGGRKTKIGFGMRRRRCQAHGKRQRVNQMGYLHEDVSCVVSLIGDLFINIKFACKFIIN